MVGLWRLPCMFVLATALVCPVSAHAQAIINEWSSVKTPPAPELKNITVDPKTTALLMLDFVKQACNQQRRPRCLATLPKASALLTEARAANMLVVYSIVSGSTTGDILREVAPTGNEPVVQSGVDKFYKTNLEQILKDDGIKTVIVIGTAAHGAVLYTASEAVLRGMKVIVPVDGISAESRYIEQYVDYNFTSAPIIAKNVALTSVAKLKFSENRPSNMN